MAIDPKALDDVAPSRSAISRLKLKKSRIKPWQSSNLIDCENEYNSDPEKLKGSLSSNIEVPIHQQKPNDNMSKITSELENISSPFAEKEQNLFSDDLSNAKDSLPTEVGNVSIKNNQPLLKPHIGTTESDTLNPYQSTQKTSFKEKLDTTQHNSTQILNTTKHNSLNIQTNSRIDNSTQLNTTVVSEILNESDNNFLETQHNQTQNGISTGIRNSTQLNTLSEYLNSYLFENIEENNSELNTTKHSKRKIDKELTKHNPTQVSNLSTVDLGVEESSFSQETKHNSTHKSENQTQHNQTQLDTTNNLKLNTTKHEVIRAKGLKAKRGEHNPTQLNTTQHNTTPHPTHQYNTTQHNNPTQLNIIENTLIRLSGNPAKVISFLCSKSLESGNSIIQMSYEMLAEISDVSLGSIRTTCARLKSQNLVHIFAPGGGRNQMIGFEIPESVRYAFSKAKALAISSRFNIDTQHNPTQILNTTQYVTPHKPHTTPNTTSSSKLVSNNNTNLLTTDRGGEESTQTTSFQSSVLNVQDIQIENLAKFNITRKQIQDIKNQRLAFTTESLQDFVDRFFIYASDSQNVRNIKSIPAIFVKMAQLASKGEDPLSDIETESDRLIRELLERKKQERERRLNLHEELLSFEFEDWLTQLDPEKQLALVPENAVARVGSGAHRMLLREYYKNHIWPDKFRELGV